LELFEFIGLNKYRLKDDGVAGKAQGKKGMEFIGKLS
jgi:hypothetical protein